MRPRVGLIGTFDVANYGDLLFPIIAQRELAERRPDVDFVWFGSVGAATPDWPVVLGLGPLSEERIQRVSDLCDAVVFGGGDLVRESEIAVAPSYGMTDGDASVWRPSAWFSSLPMISERGTPVLWNAVGVAEAVGGDAAAGASYVSVRDRRSAANLGAAGSDAAIIPDTAFLLDRVFPLESLRPAHDDLVECGHLPDGEYIAIQAATSVASELDFDAIDRLSAGRDIVVIEIGPCHGDAVTIDLARDRFGDRAWAASAPATLEGIAAAIAHASCFIGNSLHGGITSLVYDVPFRLFQFDPYSKRQGVLEVVGVGTDALISSPTAVPATLDTAVEWDRPGTLSTLDGHFDRLADLIPRESGAVPLDWSDRPEFVHLALERPPRVLDLGSKTTVASAEPPQLPAALGETIAALDQARLERAALPDLSLPLLKEFGSLRSTPDDFLKAAVAARTLRASFAEAEDGWAKAVEDARAAERGWKKSVDQVADLEASIATAEAGWANAANRAEILEISVAGLDAQLVTRSGSWLDDVAGPAVTASGTTWDGYSDYAAWRRSRAGDAEPASVNGKIRFSVLAPVFNPPAALLEACIRSVRAQSYANWELVLVDVSDAPHVAPICARFAAIDDRITVIRSDNLGISANTNRAAAEASGDWFALLDHDDELAPAALASFAASIETHPEVGFGYSDEDKIDEDGRRSDPFFKPDWSPDLLRTVNYITHLQVVRRDVWEHIGGLRPEMDGAQDYDLALRASAAVGGAFHIPDILYHWRVHEESTAADVGIKPHAHRAGRRALEDFARIHAPGSWIEFGTGPTSHRFRYPVRTQPLSIIIPFRDQAAVTDRCLTGIARTGTALPLEVLLVDNQSEEPETSAMIAEWEERYDWLRVVHYDEPFNFQKLNNWAAEQTTGELLLFLNNDTEPVHEGWVEALAEHAQRSDVGAVGGRLFYPNGLVQHAGVAVGIGGYAEHPWAGLPPDAWTAAGPSYWTRDFLAVTAACLMIDRSKFESVGGFDERFTIGGGDVALGLALHQRGYRNVMTPHARLIHHESLSRGTVVPESDLIVSRETYAPYLDGRDPYYNPNLTLDDTTCRIRPGLGEDQPLGSETSEGTFAS